MSADPLVHGVEEEILGIPRLLALPEGPWAGFRPFPSLEEAHREIARLDAAAAVRPRRELEQDTEWKQPIPYAIALYRDPAILVLDEPTATRRLPSRFSSGWTDLPARAIRDCTDAHRLVLADISAQATVAFLPHWNGSGEKRSRRRSFQILCHSDC